VEGPTPNLSPRARAHGHAFWVPSKSRSPSGVIIWFIATPNLPAGTPKVLIFEKKHPCIFFVLIKKDPGEHKK
ncbi:hypothetical protein, partial [Enterobacter asburiae]